MIVIARGRFGPTPTRVLEPLRFRGPITRDQIAKQSGLSQATVARTVATLIDEGLVRERADLAPAGAVGRPNLPVEVDPAHYAVLGVHVGRKALTVALVDLSGRPVAQVRLATPSGSLREVMAPVAEQATGLVKAHPQRTILSAGVVAPWGDLALSMDDARAMLARATGLEVATGDHVAAVAAAEYLARGRKQPGCTMYMYARDTAGFALANELPSRTEISRVGRLTHFPSGSDVACHCGALGCLEATASDEAVGRRAYDAGLVAKPDIEAAAAAARRGDLRAHQLFLDRAETLGRTAAVVRDMVAPDRVVLVGQAFTGYPQGLEAALDAFREATTLGDIEVTVTRFGAGIQAAAAGAVALGPVYADPLGVVRGETSTPVDENACNL
jgi:predicted NBD/HSP70 family sugar kinase